MSDKPSQLLESGIANLDDGKAWTKGAFSKIDNSGRVQYCMLGSFQWQYLTDERVGTQTHQYLINAIRDYRPDLVEKSLTSPDAFNDHIDTTFEDVRHVMEQAAKMAAAEGK